MTQARSIKAKIFSWTFDDADLLLKTNKKPWKMLIPSPTYTVC